MAYPNYAITRIEEYLAALADGSASEKAILASAIEEGGLGWIEPARVLYETDAAAEEITLTAPIIELTEGNSLTLSFTLGSDPAVEATATVTDVDDVLTAAFELSQSQTVTITDEAITFSTDPDGVAFTITQPAVVHMIDSDFLPAVGGGALIVTITEDPEVDPPVYTVDKTPAEVYAAVQAGKPVYGHYSASGVIYCYNLVSLSFDGETPTGYGLSSNDDTAISTFSVYVVEGETMADRHDVVL